MLDRTTVLLGAAVFAGVFGAAMLIFPPGGRAVTATPQPAETQAAKKAPLTPKQQAEMDELRLDTNDPDMTTEQKYRILDRRNLIKDYPLDVIDAADEDAPQTRDNYNSVIITPPPTAYELDVWRGTQVVCVSWRKNGRAVHETYHFKPGYISHSGSPGLVGWVRGGCAQAMAERGETQTQRQMLQELLSHIPEGDDYAEGRKSVRERLTDKRPVHEEMRGVRYYE